MSQANRRPVAKGKTLHSAPPAPEVDPGARARLLRAATELFDRKGYAAATVREIVESAGVTKPVLYYYFGSKEGLYLALLEDAFSGLSAQMAEVGEQEGPVRERILAFCDRAYLFTASNLSLMRVMYAIYYGPPQGAPPFDFEATHRHFRQSLQSLVEAAVRSGELRGDLRPEEATWAILGAINISMEIDLCQPGESLGRDGLRRLVNHLFEGLAPRGGKDAKKGANR